MGLYLDPKRWDEAIERVTASFPSRDRPQRRANLCFRRRAARCIAIGRALMMSPSVLLLDEPSAGLSPANQDFVFDLVRQIRDSGVTIVMVEQNARRCLQICDHAYVMDQGRDAHEGPGEDLLHDPKVVELYLGHAGQGPVEEPGQTRKRARRNRALFCLVSVVSTGW